MDVPKHIFFDVDGTLTRSRSEISSEMTELLEELHKESDIIFVSGATAAQVEKQMGAFNIQCIILAQNGNEASGISEDLWRNELDWLEKYNIFDWIWCAITARKPQILPDNLDDLVQDRGCQISYSLLGHHAPLEQKEAFDSTGDIRRSLLLSLPFDPFLKARISAVIGGTTCLDFFPKDCTKGTNIRRLIDTMSWNEKDCLYFGDALFEGGNDASVMGVIPFQQVKNPEETLYIMKTL